MRFIFIVAIGIMTTLAPLATAAFEGSGSILVGNPATAQVGGVTEIAAECDT